MKKLLIAAFVAGLVTVSGCTKESPEKEKDINNGLIIGIDTTAMDTVTINFSRGFETTEEPMKTRTVTDLASIVNRLDVWITDGETTQTISQVKTDANFGKITATLNKTKTYTLYSVAHKCDTPATLADGIISFPDDKVTHSLYYTTTFSPATTSTIDAEMKRIVAMFRIETTDVVPTAAKKMRISITDVFDRWDVSAGVGTHQLDRTSTINISSTNNDGTAAFSVYAITSAAETLHTVTIEALDANDAAVQTPLVINNVKMRNGYKTIYRGAFFTDKTFTMTMTAEDWSEYDVVTF